MGSDYESDLEEEEEAQAKGRGGKQHPDGELVDDLEEDDFAFGSGSEDDLDELSSMSEWSDAPPIDTDLSDMSGLGSEDDDEEGLWSDEDVEEPEGGPGAEGGEDEPAFDSEEELNVSVDDEDEDEEDGSSDFDTELDDSALLAGVSAKKPKRMAPADDLEAAYEAKLPSKKVKEPKPLPTRLPTIENGKVVRSAETLERAAVLQESDEEEEEEVRPKQVQEYKSDPLGQRFGRPAVRQLLETRDKRERVQRAREEIADLGREAAGTGEGEGGVRSFPFVEEKAELTWSLVHSSISSSDCSRYAPPPSIRLQQREAPVKSLSLSTGRFGLWPWSRYWQSLSTSSRKRFPLASSQTMLITNNVLRSGYRIRALTDAEKEVQVSQLVARQREWENGLVATYKRFLELCEAEVTGASLFLLVLRIDT